MSTGVSLMPLFEHIPAASNLRKLSQSSAEYHQQPQSQTEKTISRFLGRVVFTQVFFIQSFSNFVDTLE